MHIILPCDFVVNLALQFLQIQFVHISDFIIYILLIYIQILLYKKIIFVRHCTLYYLILLILKDKYHGILRNSNNQI